jgi:hypothetical protein
MPTAAQQSIAVPVLRWHHWEGPADQLPELKSVEPLLRRRLSPQGRAALAVADVCAQGVGPVRVVFASQHGELARTLSLMESLRPEDPDGPSPTSFALSVLNSTPGIYSIARKDTSPAVAVSAGAESAWCGLLEAALTAQEEACPVLFIAAEAPVPALFRHGEADPAPIRALAVLISSAGEGYHLTFGPADPAFEADAADALTALARALRQGGGWMGEGRAWTLVKHA